MVELSANMSWLDPVDWHDLDTFEPVYDAGNDIDSVERIAHVEAMAAALFKPFFETGLMGFDSCPRDELARNCLLRIHCARSVDDYADYSRSPQLPSSAESQPSIEEEWEHLLMTTPTSKRFIQGVPSSSHKSTSAFKPNPPKHPPTPMSHVKARKHASHTPLQSSTSIKQEQYTSAHRQAQSIPKKPMPSAHSRVATPESDGDSGEEDTENESLGPRRTLFKQLSSSTLVNSDTQQSSGAPSRDAAIADLIRDIAEDSQEVRL